MREPTYGSRSKPAWASEQFTNDLRDDDPSPRRRIKPWVVADIVLVVIALGWILIGLAPTAVRRVVAAAADQSTATSSGR